MKKTIRTGFWSLALAACLSFPALQARSEEIKPLPQDPAPPPAAATLAPMTIEDAAAEARFQYEKPTLQKLSRLYWALGMLDENNNENVDNFLMINECDLYKDYYYNEFEWKEIRETARESLKLTKNTFPLRFELVQPLLLTEYDLKKKTFKVKEQYKIKNMSRFQMFPDDYDRPVCLDDSSGRIAQVKGYPTGIIAEINRPLNVEEIPVDEKAARIFIDQGMEAFKLLPSHLQNAEGMANTRKAYLFMHMKFFAFKGVKNDTDSGVPMANILAVLEDIEVYADKDKNNLLYRANFRKKRTRGDATERPEATSGSDTLVDPATTAVSRPEPAENDGKGTIPPASR